MSDLKGVDELRNGMRRVEPSITARGFMYMTVESLVECREVGLCMHTRRAWKLNCQPDGEVMSTRPFGGTAIDEPKIKRRGQWKQQEYASGGRDDGESAHILSD